MVLEPAYIGKLDRLDPEHHPALVGPPIVEHREAQSVLTDLLAQRPIVRRHRVPPPDLRVQQDPTPVRIEAQVEAKITRPSGDGVTHWSLFNTAGISDAVLSRTR